LNSVFSRVINRIRIPCSVLFLDSMRMKFYVVPGGVQADQYILDSLKFLPVSFAITNDRFRDYADRYPSVMADNQWRKGVVFSNGEIHLHQHKFQKPVLLPTNTTS
jgi:hypothetical protein